MIAVKVIIRGSFISTTRNQNPLHHHHHHPSFEGRRNLCVLCESKSDESKGKGDPRKQELLAKIAMLQTQKLRLTDYLDERSSYLTHFAEEANAEIDAIGDNALKHLDQAASRIMENIESKMQAFEESSEMNKEDIAKREKELEAFEDEIDKGLNEGLFFQSLTKRPPADKAKAKEETNKISIVTKQNVASKTRRNIYLGLIGLLAVGIADSFVSASPDWRKVAVLGAILIALFSQFVYEQKMLSESEKDGGGNNNGGGEK